MQRRTLMSQALVTSVALLGGRLSMAARPDHQIDALVIGAGLAGLACTQQLMAAGQRVVVLEARQRIGGRIWTEHRQGCAIDMGASWLHGVASNPLHRLVTQDLRLAVIPTDEQSRITIGLNGQRWSADRTDRADAWLDALVRSAEQSGSADQPLSRLLTQPLSSDQRFILIADIEHELGAPLSAIAANAPLGDGQELLGGDALVPAGLDRVVQHLARNAEIRLGQVVQKIENHRQGVRVTTTTGAVFEASRLCCTVPLGVLKRKPIQFEPPLPKEKALAIKHLGMGVLDKIVLLFPQRFWDPTTWLRNDGPEVGFWPEWVDLTGVIGRPALMGFIAANQAQQLERLPDQAILTSALNQLKRCYPQLVIPAPTDVLMTRWSEDPFACGSYSFPAVGSTPGMRADLAQRWDAMVFAGEAVSTTHPATLQGAYLSGIKAAQALLA